jgi:hypothetical protein
MGPHAERGLPSRTSASPRSRGEGRGEGQPQSPASASDSAPHPSPLPAGGGREPGARKKHRHGRPRKTGRPGQ